MPKAEEEKPDSFILHVIRSRSMVLAGCVDQADLRLIEILLNLSNIKITGMRHHAWLKMSNCRF